MCPFKIEKAGKMAKKPLEFLNELLNSKVTVMTRSGELLRGNLSAVDEHMNLTIEGTELVEGKCSKPGESVHIKGENLVYISKE